jgi:hypothetical protein
MIVGRRILSPIECDQDRKFSRQALFDIGGFEGHAADGDVAVFGRTAGSPAAEPAVQSGRILV